MKKSLLIGALLAVTAASSALGAWWTHRHARVAFIDPADTTLVQRGEPLYQQHCATCHGARLEGQPNWRQRMANGRLPAPPHDVSGHTWHHPDQVLLDITRNGLVPGRTAPDGYQSDMPGFADKLSDPDIRAVLAYIKRSWPADALRAQKEITEQRAQ